MVRRASLAAAVVVGLLGVTAAASAKDGLRATFTTPIPANRAAGDHVRIAWTLRDGAGRPISLKRVFVKIVLPDS